MNSEKLTPDEKMYIENIVAPFKSSISFIRYGWDDSLHILWANEDGRLGETVLPHMSLFRGLQKDKMYSCQDLGLNHR